MEHTNTMPEALVTFCYPSTIGSCDLTTAFQNPTAILQGFCRQELQTLYITAGMIFDTQKKYQIRADVTFNGQSLTPADDDNVFGKMHTPSITVTNCNKVATVTTMELTQIDMSKDGVYCAIVEIHECDSERKPIKMVASNNCSFIVS